MAPPSANRLPSEPRARATEVRGKPSMPGRTPEAEAPPLTSTQSPAEPPPPVRGYHPPWGFWRVWRCRLSA